MKKPKYERETITARILAISEIDPWLMIHGQLNRTNTHALAPKHRKWEMLLLDRNYRKLRGSIPKGKTLGINQWIQFNAQIRVQPDFSIQFLRPTKLKLLKHEDLVELKIPGHWNYKGAA